MPDTGSGGPPLSGGKVRQSINPGLQQQNPVLVFLQSNVRIHASNKPWDISYCRMLPIKPLISWKLGDLAVVNNNAGAPFTVVDARPATLADCGPDTWPMLDVAINNPRVPFYIPSMEFGRAILTGKEPLCKVQLTQLEDGCILGITLSHTLTDGMHWPALMTHIAARYRQVATGKLAPTEELVTCPSRPDSLSLEPMKKKLLSDGQEWSPEPFDLAPGIGDFFRTGVLLWANVLQTMQLEILYIPKTRIMALKSAVVEGLTGGQMVSTGDVVQALAALATHVAEGRPLLPVRPNCLLTLIQVPGAETNYFGNAVHPMLVRLEPGEPQPDGDDMLGVLRCLAAHIRSATHDLRLNPSQALQALYESQQVCETPVAKTLVFLAGQRMPYVTCTTNFIGNMATDQGLDFGLGVKPQGYRSLTYPLARGMAVIRPSMEPYNEGLFLSLSLTSAQFQTLKAHPLLQTLAPDAQFLEPARMEKSVGVKVSLSCFPRKNNNAPSS